MVEETFTITIPRRACDIVYQGLELFLQYAVQSQTPLEDYSRMLKESFRNLSNNKVAEVVEMTMLNPGNIDVVRREKDLMSLQEMLKITAINPMFYEKCSEITKDYETVCGRWSEDSQLLHVMTEVAELKDVLRNKDEKYGKIGSPEHMAHILDELADIHLTAFATTNYLGVDGKTLNDLLDKKINIVRERVEELKRRTAKK